MLTEREKRLTSRPVIGRLCASSEAEVGWAKSNTAGQKKDDINLMKESINNTSDFCRELYIRININRCKTLNLPCFRGRTGVGHGLAPERNGFAHE